MLAKNELKPWSISFLLGTVLFSILIVCGKLALLFSFPMAFFKILDTNICVNSEKFQCIIFGIVDDPGEFIIDKHSIVPEKTVKLLGIHLGNKLASLITFTHMPKSKQASQCTS